LNLLNTCKVINSYKDFIRGEVVFSRKLHPSLVDYDVIIFYTKVRHELLVSKGMSDKDILQLIAEYLKQYEEVFPNTKDEKVWAELSRLKGDEV
jgi:hypothetical protein